MTVGDKDPSFGEWLTAAYGATEQNDGSYSLEISGHDGPVEVEFDNSLLEEKLPEIIAGAEDVWPARGKSPRVLGYQLLSVHIEEQVFSSAGESGALKVIFTTNGFRVV